MTIILEVLTESVSEKYTPLYFSLSLSMLIAASLPSSFKSGFERLSVSLWVCVPVAPVPSAGFPCNQGLVELNRQGPGRLTSFRF